MDLTDLAQTAAERARAAREDAARERAALGRINDASTLRLNMKSMLGVVVADDDLIWCEKTRKHGVIVDGKALVLCIGQSTFRTGSVRLVPHAIDSDGVFHYLDASLTLSDHVGNLEDLGKLLDPKRSHYSSGSSGEGRRYQPGVGFEAAPGGPR